MWTKAELFGFIANRERKADAPPEPEPSGPVPGSMEWHRARILKDVAEGKAISMNDLARSVPKPKPPKRPSWER
jgi:hypothetical protein